MTDIQFADPVSLQDENTRKVLSILPPLDPPPAPPPPVVERPSDNHVKPHVMPPIQEQIKETAQPYRPYQPHDGLPTGANVGSANALKAAQLTRGQQNAQDEAIAQLAYFGGYALVGIYDGITNQYSDNSNLLFPRDGSEDAAYEFGHKIADLTKDGLKNADKVIKDFRDNPPHFEIPQIKISKPEFPQLPQVKLPQLPEFKLPEFKFDEPQDKDKPIIKPKTKPLRKQKLREQDLRENDISQCGQIYFEAVYTTRVTGDRFVQNNQGGYDFIIDRYQASFDEAYDFFEENQGVELADFLGYGNATGASSIQNVSSGVSYKFENAGGRKIFQNNQPSYPYYDVAVFSFLSLGSTSKNAIGQMLDNLAVSGFTPTIIKIDLLGSENKACPIDKYPDPDPPPPDPPDPECDCMAQCCPDIDYRKIQAIIREEIEKLDLVSAIPLSWQIRNEGNRPQLIIQCAEEDGVDKSGNKKYKSAKYPISVPHWDGSPGEQIFLPSYIKGNYEGIYTLKDNSKITINSQNEIECKRILQAIIPHVSKTYLEDAYFKGGLIVRDDPIKESRVKPKYGRYFKDGQKNNKPDWRIDFL